MSNLTVKNDIVSTAESLIPLIREHRHTTEQNRRIAEPIVQAIRGSDLGRILLDTGESPRYTPEAWLRVLETLAGAEASVAWLVWNTTLPCFWTRFLEDEGRARILSDSRLFACSVRPTGQAVPTAGGYQVQGRWALVSSCELADYVSLMCVVHEDGEPRLLAPGQPELRVLFVPKGSYTILDTWHTGGLRGSGGHDVVVDDVFVPAEESFVPALPEASTSQLAQMPIMPVMTAGYGAMMLGMARAATAATTEILRNKVSVDPNMAIDKRPSVLADIASSIAAVAAARGHLYTTMTTMWEKARNQLPTTEDRAALHSAALHAAATGRACVETMHAAAGTTALYVECPLERSIRDLQAMKQHIAAQPLWLEDAGRVQVGQEPAHPLFML